MGQTRIRQGGPRLIYRWAVRCLAWLGLMVVLIAATAPCAFAANAPDDDASAPASKPDPSGAPDYEHTRQFGVRLGFTGGYRMLFRYNQSPYCIAPNPAKAPKDQEKFCGHGAPFALDVALSFAPAASIEPFLWGRFGFTSESATDTKPLVLLGAGARLYTMSDSAFKVFIEPAFGFELEDGRHSAAYATNNPSYKTDFLFHLAAGPQLDLAKYFGVYLDAGLTVGILRGIDSTLELTGGLQGRFP
jgi:hypothetical protein